MAPPLVFYLLDKLLRALHLGCNGIDIFFNGLYSTRLRLAMLDTARRKALWMYTRV